MACPKNGPCQPFVDELSLCCLVSGGFQDPCLSNGEPVPQAIVDNAIEAASELLWAMTGRQFGRCTVTLRPCQQGGGCNPCPDGGELPFFNVGDLSWGGSYPWYPAHTENGWINVRPCGCKNLCGCEALCDIQLPYPVCCIEEVKVDGVVIAQDLYRVDDFRRLVRLPGNPNFGGNMRCDNMQTALGPVNGPVVSGNISVTGPGAAPGVTDLFGLSGVELPNDGALYTVDLGANFVQGLNFEVQVPVGCPGGSFSVGGLAGGNFEVDVIQGGATVEKAGITVTFSGAGQQNQPIVLRVRATDIGSFTGPEFNITPINTCGQGLNLLKVCYVAPTQTMSCDVTPTLRRISGAPNQGAICDVVPSPASFTSTKVGACYEGQGDLVFAPIKTLAFKIADGTNPSAGLNQFTLEAPENDDPGGIYFWPLHPLPYQVGDTFDSHTSPNGSFARVTVTSIVGTGPSVTNEAGVNVPVGSEVGFSVELFCQILAEAPCWPECQNLALPDTEEGTFSVTVTYGRPVPALVKLATAELACQLIKACMNQPCQLPQRMQSLSRQGVTVGFLDPQSFFAQGLTGIYLVDLAIKQNNPHGLLKQASVYSIDQGKRWTRTNTAGDC